MGTWGPNSFENDTAADFVDGLEDAAGLQDALQDVMPDHNMDASRAETIIAAADCVAVMMGRVGPGTQKELVSRLKKLGAPPPELVDAAKEAVSSVMAGGELLELWGETDASDFNEAITLLMLRLNPESEVVSHEPVKPHKLKINCVFCDKPVDPDDLLELTVQINAEKLSSMTHYKPCHHVCLNRALNPKHLVQHWEFSDDDLARLIAHMDS